MGKITVTVIVENTARANLLGEHGLSMWIETPDGAILFDTGQGGVIQRNAGHLGIDVSSAKAIVLSHGHYDHTGGLELAMAVAPEARVCFHPAAIEPKYLRTGDGESRYVGVPPRCLGGINRRSSQVQHTTEVTEILGGVCATGSIPRGNEFENTGGPFFLDSECTEADPLADDQALYFDSPDGTVVLLGCAHAGIVNTLRYVRELTGGRPIHAVFGGTHLAAADESRLERTAQALSELGVQRIGLSHCTGWAAEVRLGSVLAGRCAPCHCGMKITF